MIQILSEASSGKCHFSWPTSLRVKTKKHNSINKYTRFPIVNNECIGNGRETLHATVIIQEQVLIRIMKMDLNTLSNVPFHWP